MRGNILTQTNWQVKAVFTLTVLFATTCLLLTNLSAEWDRKEGWAFEDDLGRTVWGEAYASTWYDAPFARSFQYAYVSNQSKKLVRAYYTFLTTITVPVGGPDFADILKKGAWDVQAGDWWTESTPSKVFRYNLRGEVKGVYIITAKSDLTVKAQVGRRELSAPFNARASTRIDTRKQ